MRKMLLSACVALTVLGCGGDDGDLPPCLDSRCMRVYSICGDRAYDASTEFCYEGTVYSVKSDISNYRTVVIGTQTWMAENLDYNVEGSKCYDNDLANCNTYGRLYDWATAMALPPSCNSNSCANMIQSPHRGICPSGWHIPSNDDWDVLMTTVGGYDTAGTKLKAGSGWRNYYQGTSGNGTDEYGFSALPGGYGNPDGYFGYVNNDGNWWSASEDDSDSASDRHMYSSYDYVSISSSYKSYLYSVRCLQD